MADDNLDHIGEIAETTLTRGEVMTFRSSVIEPPSAPPPRPSAAPERLPTLGDLIRRPAWQRHAACLGRGVDDWYSTRGDHDAVARARAICSGCPVRDDCLEHAQQHRATEKWGMWGGLSPRQRVELRRRRDHVDDAVAG